MLLKAKKEIKVGFIQYSLTNVYLLTELELIEFVFQYKKKDGSGLKSQFKYFNNISKLFKP